MSAARRKARYGDKWRVLAHRRDGSSVAVENDGQFDELVLENVLHLEQMGNRLWWMQLGDASLPIHVPSKGKARISIRFGEDGPATQWTIDGPLPKEARVIP